MLIRLIISLLLSAWDDRGRNNLDETEEERVRLLRIDLDGERPRRIVSNEGERRENGDKRRRLKRGVGKNSRKRSVVWKNLCGGIASTISKG